MSNSDHAPQDSQPFGDVARRLASVVDGANRRDPILSKRLTVLADVQGAPIDWIWPGRIARGKLHVLAGDPGLGKSFLTLDIASRITSGNAWPDGGIAPIGNVLVFSLEDDAADTIRPRVAAMGGDEYRIWVENRRANTLSLDREIRDLQELIIKTDAVLVVIDPLNAYLGGGVDTFNDAKVRTVLGPLSTAASATKAAVLAVMHLNKNEEMGDLYRVGGSIGFIGAARLVFTVSKDPADPTTSRLLTPLKTNISKPAATLAYRLVEKQPDQPVVEWDGERDTPSAGALRTTTNSGRDDEALERAETFLREILGNGSRLSADVEKEARRKRIADRTLERARKKLGVEATKSRDLAGNPWVMSLPTQSPTAQ